MAPSDLVGLNLKLWLRTARRHARLSQAALADALGLPLRTVGQWESAHCIRRVPSTEGIAAIEKLTGFSLPADLAELRRQIPPRKRPNDTQRPASSVSDEIRAAGELLSRLKNWAKHRARNARVFAQRYGVDGSECSSLQSIATRYRISREGVRLIVDRMIEAGAAAGVALRGDQSTRLADTVRSLPTQRLESADAAVRELLGERLSLADAQRFASDMLGRPLPFSVLSIPLPGSDEPPLRLFVPGDSPDYIDSAVSHAKRLVRLNGAAHFDLVWSATQRGTNQRVDAELLRSVLELMPSYRALDDTVWFWFGPDAGDNRVLSRVTEILAVAKGYVDIEEIQAGLARNVRRGAESEVAEFSPPRAVLAALLRACPQFRQRQSDDFALTKAVDGAGLLSGTAAQLLAIFEAAGGVCSRNHISRVAAGKINPITLTAVLASHPIFRPLDHGVFALRGRRIDAEDFARAKREVGVSLRPRRVDRTEPQTTQPPHRHAGQRIRARNKRLRAS